MVVQMLDRGKFRTVGTIRLVNGLVELRETRGSMRSLREFSYGRKYTPADGVDYLRALVDKFSRSSSVNLVKEKEDDAWLMEQC